MCICAHLLPYKLKCRIEDNIGFITFSKPIKWFEDSGKAIKSLLKGQKNQIKFVVFELREILLVTDFFFRAAPEAYGGSQARGPIGAVAAGLLHSNSNAASKRHLWPSPQLTAMPDP